MVTLDPRISLATALNAQSGVYALLIGSGTSTGAGIPTGWGVVEALVQRAAVAGGTAVDEDFDTEAWWDAHGDGNPLGYSNLLERLASTPASRRALLAGFFEPTEEEREAGLKIPSPAHHAIAALVKRGLVRVIVTTNFDRLLERAIEAAGVSPQVISSEAAITGMEPLQHMPCTILKLHGDYASLDQRNTVDELSEYPKQTSELLARILAEYGLIISGWSGDWDPALVGAIEVTASRRYPVYWTSRSALGETARRLTTRSGVHVVTGVTADDFFPDLEQRVEAIELMADAPESVSMMIARLKRALPNPVRHLELRDLFEAELTKLSDYIRDLVEQPGPASWEATEEGLAELRGRSSTLLHLFTTGILLDRDRQHNELWVWVIERAMAARPARMTTTVWDELAHYPALLLLRAGTIAALLAKHEDVARSILQKPKWGSGNGFSGNDQLRPAWDVLSPWSILDRDRANSLPRNTSANYRWPMSRMVRADLKDFIDPIAGGQDYTRLHSQAEYRAALAWLFDKNTIKDHTYPTDGEFIGDGQWTRSEPIDLIWSADFLANADRDAWGDWGSNWEWFKQQLDGLTEHLFSRRRG